MSTEVNTETYFWTALVKIVIWKTMKLKPLQLSTLLKSKSVGGLISVNPEICLQFNEGIGLGSLFDQSPFENNSKGPSLRRLCSEGW